MMNIDMVYASIKEILQKHISNPGYQFMIFGSRATGAARVYSDVDIAVIGDAPIDLGILARVNEDLEESSIPVNVDIVDFSRVSSDFRRIASQHMVLL